MTININSVEISSKILILINRIAQRSEQPILVAIDGASGAGKSTLASMLEQRTDTVVVPSDDFFAANIPDWEWDTRSVPERARDVLDWQRLRKEALELLLENKTAKWHPFDFAAGIRSDGTYGMSEKYVEKQPAPVIILEGAYSSNPVLADLIDLKILIDVPVLERHQRLEKREEDKQFLQRWHILWDAVEEYYFSEIMSTSSFDLVITNTGFIEN
ncbi:MAG: zeta toxin family protein, partial [Anaerolineae bacterium]|nr:zeta toxin family protein [Anaerolineae bacterium]